MAKIIEKSNYKVVIEPKRLGDYGAIRVSDSLCKLWDHVQALNISVGLSQSTIDEVCNKINSRLAFCEKSIKDNS